MFTLWQAVHLHNYMFSFYVSLNPTISFNLVADYSSDYVLFHINVYADIDQVLRCRRQHGIVGWAICSNSAYLGANPNSAIYSVHELFKCSAISLTYKMGMKIIALP